MGKELKLKGLVLITEYRSKFYDYEIKEIKTPEYEAREIVAVFENPYFFANLDEESMKYLDKHAWAMLPARCSPMTNYDWEYFKNNRRFYKEASKENPNPDNGWVNPIACKDGCDKSALERNGFVYVGKVRYICKRYHSLKDTPGYHSRVKVDQDSNDKITDMWVNPLWIDQQKCRTQNVSVKSRKYFLFMRDGTVFELNKGPEWDAAKDRLLKGRETEPYVISISKTLVHLGDISRIRYVYNENLLFIRIDLKQADRTGFSLVETLSKSNSSIKKWAARKKINLRFFVKTGEREYTARHQRAAGFYDDVPYAHR